MKMNRRGFVGSISAIFAGLFLPRKLKAVESDEFKFGDCVEIEEATAKPRKIWVGYVTYIHEGTIRVQTSWNEYVCYYDSKSNQWYWWGQGPCLIRHRKT